LDLRPVGEPRLPPETVNALRVHGPPFALQQRRNEAVAVAGVLGGESVDSSYQRPVSV
jgi:hypothetical protein